MLYLRRANTVLHQTHELCRTVLKTQVPEEFFIFFVETLRESLKSPTEILKQKKDS